jgi:hypothetical protein
MKRSLALITALGALAVAVPAASAHPSCYSKRYVTDITVEHGRHIKHYRPYITTLSTAKVRVYSTVGDDFGSIYYACWRASGHSHRLAVNTGGAQVYDAYVEDVQVQDKYVGFTYESRGEAPNNYDEWVVVDATTGRRVQDLKIPVDASTPPHSTAMALRPDGTMAAIYWTADGSAHIATAG